MKIKSRDFIAQMYGARYFDALNGDFKMEDCLITQWRFHEVGRVVECEYLGAEKRAEIAVKYCRRGIMQEIKLWQYRAVLTGATLTRVGWRRRRSPEMTCLAVGELSTCATGEDHQVE
jgi:hypothetical protein